MKKNWCLSIVLAFILIGLSCLVSLLREQVFAQPQAVPQQTPAATPPVQGPAVVIRQQPELPRCFVDVTLMDDPVVPGKKVQIITIVDTESKHILVYQSDMGKVKLLSTRNFQPDLMYDQFNAVEPTPSEIRREAQRLRDQMQRNPALSNKPQ